MLQINRPNNYTVSFNELIILSDNVYEHNTWTNVIYEINTRYGNEKPSVCVYDIVEFRNIVKKMGLDDLLKRLPKILTHSQALTKMKKQDVMDSEGITWRIKDGKFIYDGYRSGRGIKFTDFLKTTFVG